MKHDLQVVAHGSAFATTAADLIRRAASVAVAEKGVFRIAVSGGHTPWPVFDELAGDATFPWARTVVFQVDERVVPRDDPDRNLAHLAAVLPPTCSVAPMPVDDPDLDAACERYAQQLPETFDLLHLGLGSDGHTASLVPGDPVLDVDDRLVALTARPYQGHRRMTLTYPGISRARSLLWLVTGADKGDALRRLVTGDRSIPAGLVEAPRSTVVTDISVS